MPYDYYTLYERIKLPKNTTPIIAYKNQTFKQTSILHIAPQTPIYKPYKKSQLKKLNSLLNKIVNHLPHNKNISFFNYMPTENAITIGHVNIYPPKSSNDKIVSIKDNSIELFFFPSIELAKWSSYQIDKMYNLTLEEINQIHPQLLEKKLEQANLLSFKIFQQTSNQDV